MIAGAGGAVPIPVIAKSYGLSSASSFVMLIVALNAAADPGSNRTSKVVLPLAATVVAGCAVTEYSAAPAPEIVTVPCRSDNYAYLVRDRASGKVALVDAPAVDPIVAALDQRGWGLDQIWITHHHGDHTEGVAALRARYGAEVVGHAKDR